MTDTGARLHGAAAPLLPALRHALLNGRGPVTLMIHGFKYQPGLGRHCPHGSLFALSPAAPPPRPSPRITSWPQKLGLNDAETEGLGIAIGWPARGTIWDAYRQAEDTGIALSALLSDIRRIAPARPVHILAHSLGARVAMTALKHCPAGSVDRIILLAAAEYRAPTRDALQSPAGLTTEVLNVTSRENDLFDFLMERLVAPSMVGDRMLGHEALCLRNCVTLQLDDAKSLGALEHAGFGIAPPDRRVCHWSPYLRAGVFPLYRAFLSGDMPLWRLRAMLPDAAAPRWSRLLPMRRATTRAVQIAAE